jgi:circadian clock protein KaiC
MTFEEDAGRLIVKADMLGMELSRPVEAGQLRVHWESTVHRPLDSWADELLDAVVALNAKRLVIDGLDHLTRIAVYGERFGPFLTSLCQRLRSNGVATVFIIETPSVDDGGFLGPLADTAASLDNVVLLRYVEPHARLHRLISVLRMRESGFDATVREFSISDRGIEIEPTGVGATAALDELQGTAAPPGDEANLDE